MKKVVHVITSLGDGGAEGVLYRLLNSCKNSEHIVVSLQDHGKYGPKLVDEGFKVYSLGFYSLKNLLSSCAELHKIFKFERPDVIQSWMYHADFFGGLIGKFCGVRKIYWGIRNSNLGRTESSLSVRAINVLNIIASYFLPNKIICCAHSASQYHSSIGYNSSKMQIIENGFDVQKFNSNETVSSINESDKIFHIGIVARFDPQKDHLSFISALSILRNSGRNFKASIIGTGVINSSLVAEIVRLGLNDIVTLNEPRDDIVKFYQMVDLNVLCSAYGEGFPNVLAEAMASKTPCVATDVGDSNYIIEKCGWLVPPKSPSHLAAAIACAMDLYYFDNVKWQQLRSSCRERIINNFTIEKMVEKFERLWDSNG